MSMEWGESSSEDELWLDEIANNTNVRRGDEYVMDALDVPFGASVNFDSMNTADWFTDENGDAFGEGSFRQENYRQTILEMMDQNVSPLQFDESELNSPPQAELISPLHLNQLALAWSDSDSTPMSSGSEFDSPIGAFHDALQFSDSDSSMTMIESRKPRVPTSHAQFSKAIRFAPQVATAVGIALLDTFETIPLQPTASDRRSTAADEEFSDAVGLMDLTGRYEESPLRGDSFQEEQQPTTIPELQEDLMLEDTLFEEGDSVATPMLEEESISTTDMLMLGGGAAQTFEDEYSEKNEDKEEDEEEAKIKRGLMYAAGGMGLMALVGWGLGKIQTALGRSHEDDPVATADAIRTSAETAGNASRDATTAGLVGSDPVTISNGAAEAGAFNTSATFTTNGISYAPGVSVSSQ